MSCDEKKSPFLPNLKPSKLILTLFILLGKLNSVIFALTPVTFFNDIPNNLVLPPNFPAFSNTC